MLWSTDETLQRIEPHLSPILVSPGAFSDIRTVTRVFPDALSAYYLECRLGGEDNQVDLLACTMGAQGGRAVLAGRDGTAGLPAFVLASPLWQRVQDFLRAWNDPAGPLYDAVPLCWMEFDIQGPPPAVPLPSMHLCLDGGYGWPAPSAASGPPLTAQVYRRLTEIACERLLEAPPRHVRRILLDCFAALPRGGSIIHLSVMLARQPVAFKVFSQVPQHALPAYLDRVGWPGDAAALQELLKTFCPEADTIRVELNVEDEVLSKTGIEFLASTRPDPDPDRRTVLRRCLSHGLCTPEKYEAAMAWPGATRERYNRHTWPTRLQRWLDVKLIYQHHRPLEAKGYLGFMPGFSLL